MLEEIWYTLWDWYLKICRIIYWPILYPLIIIHELTHLAAFYITNMPVTSVGLGTQRDTHKINFGYRLTGHVSFTAGVYHVTELPSNMLKKHIFIALFPSLYLPVIGYYAWHYPLVMGIPFIYYIYGSFGDWEFCFELLEAIKMQHKYDIVEHRLTQVRYIIPAGDPLPGPMYHRLVENISYKLAEKYIPKKKNPKQRC